MLRSGGEKRRQSDAAIALAARRCRANAALKTRQTTRRVAAATNGSGAGRHKRQRAAAIVTPKGERRKYEGIGATKRWPRKIMA